MILPPVTDQIPPTRSASGKRPNNPRRSQRLRSNRQARAPANGPRWSDAGRDGTTGGASRTSRRQSPAGGTGLSARSAIELLLLRLGVLLLDRLAQIFLHNRELCDHFFNAVAVH